MRTQKVLILAIMALSCSFGTSCRAALESSGDHGDANVSISLSGFLSPSAGKTASRLLLPVTNQVRVVVERYADIESGNDNPMIYCDKTWVTGNASVSITGLPDSEPLWFSVTALNSGTQLSSGSVIATLDVGTNSLALTLFPTADPSGVVSVDSSSMYISVDATLAAGAWSLGKISIADTSSWYQILVDSGTSRTAWLGLYDANWNLVDTVAGSSDEGWFVVKGDTSACYYAVANCLDCPGWSSSTDISVSVSLRPAVFVSLSGNSDNSGAPLSPKTITSLGTDGSSYFIEGGSYGLASNLVLQGDLRVYGGFKSGDWSVRDVDAYQTKITSSDTSGISPLYLGDTAVLSGLVDGLCVTAFKPVSSDSYSTSAVTVLYGNSLVLQDCVFSGFQTGDCSFAASSSGLSVTNDVAATAGIELAGCRISGIGDGTSGTSDITSIGLEVSQGLVKIHNCDIDGGSARSTSNASAISMGICGESGATLVVSSSRIWGGFSSGTASSADTIGVASSGVLYMTNSLVSGGRSESATASVSTYALKNYGTSMIVDGCGLDSGYGTSSATSYWLYDGYGDGPSITIMSDTLTAPPGMIPGISMSGSDTLNYYTCFEFGSSLTVATSYSLDSYLNTAGIGKSPAALYAKYSGDFAASSSGFEAWTGANDWHVTASAMQNLSSCVFVNSGLSSLVSTYPFLLVDRDGTVRPSSASAGWRPGAFAE